MNGIEGLTISRGRLVSQIGLLTAKIVAGSFMQCLA